MEINLKTHINFVKCSSCTICKKEPIEEFEVQKLKAVPKEIKPKLTRLNSRQIDFFN